MIIEEYIKYLAEVLKCAVTGQQPSDMPPDIDEDEFIKFSAFHKVDNIVYMTIGDRLSQENRVRLESSYNRSIMVQATQQYYLERVESAFEENGIDYLVLKGRELARLYPSEDMRQSSDFDIYIGRENAQKGKAIMLELGFNIEAYSDTDDDHDEYIIDNFVIFEAEICLFFNKIIKIFTFLSKNI